MMLQFKPAGWTYLGMVAFGALAMVGVKIAEYALGLLPAVLAALPKG